MAATFIVEDGSGLTDSNSYLSVEDADQYFDNHSAPVAWTSAVLADKQNALRIATQYLDVVFGEVWVERRTNDEQALDWPRAFVNDSDGFAVESDIIPQAIEDATAEMALRSISGTTLLPDLTKPGGIGREKVKVGPIEKDTTYVGSASQIPRFSIVDALVEQFTIGTAGGFGIQEVRRA